MSERTPDSGNPLPFDLPGERELKLASPATVKRRKTSYGDAGILMLTTDRLVFVTDKLEKCWSLQRSEIARIKRPWYGMGTYVTFTGRGEYYALAFAEDAVDTSRISSIPDALGDSAATAGLQAVAVAKGFRAASTGGEWYAALTGQDVQEREDDVADMEALWAAQQRGDDASG